GICGSASTTSTRRRGSLLRVVSIGFALGVSRACTGSAPSPPAGLPGRCIERVGEQWNHHPRGRAAAELRLERERAAVLLHDAYADADAQPGAAIAAR